MFDSVLIATDGSDHGHRAVEAGCELARRFEGSLAILHVIGHGALPEGLRRMAEAWVMRAE